MNDSAKPQQVIEVSDNGGHTWQRISVLATSPIFAAIRKLNGSTPYDDGFGSLYRKVQGSRRGWYEMACWNGLSEAQQTRLVEWGNLPIFSEPEGTCLNGAEVAIETQTDQAPGPRFYCLGCGIKFLQEQGDQE